MKREELLRTIELKRKQMIKAALIFGFCHDKTVTYSRELDEYLNNLGKIKDDRNLEK